MTEDHDTASAICERIEPLIVKALEVTRAHVHHEIITAAYRPEPKCRDCADADGRCPNTGRLCDPFEAALERLREHELIPGLKWVVAHCDSNHEYDCPYCKQARTKLRDLGG